jgi:hypothetical protein
MATRPDIPLNLFVRKKLTVKNTYESIYEVPEFRAGIIISALATNTQPIPNTVTVAISSKGEPGYFHTLINNFEIPPNDAANLVINKFVITEGDAFCVRAGNSNVVNLTLAVLESINTPD